MLTARSDLVFGESRMRTWLWLARRFRAVLVLRNRLLYDSRFSSAGERRPGALNVYVVLEGVVERDDHTGTRGPAVWVLTDSEFESADREGRTFRSWGDPFIALDLRVRETDVAGPVGLRAGPRTLPPESLRHLEALAGAFMTGTDAVPHAIIRSLSEEGILTGDLPADLLVPDEEPERVRRLWEVIADLYSRSEVLPYLAAMSEEAGVSYRQLDRDIAELCRDYELQGDSLRSATRTIRIREALLLLSAPAMSITDVARQVGYGSAVAMASAFRASGLPSPRRVRERVAYPSSPST